MTTEIKDNQQVGLVQEMRKIRDQISREIRGMTFEEERAYLDKLLSEKRTAGAQQGIAKSGAEE